MDIPSGRKSKADSAHEAVRMDQPLSQVGFGIGFARDCRAAYRRFASPLYTDGDNGVRFVRTATD